MEALGTTLAKFFQEETEEKLVFTDDDYFVDEREECTIHWIVPNAQKNEMEPILLELPTQGQSHEVAVHEGEEFGYVLQGSISTKSLNSFIESFSPTVAYKLGKVILYYMLSFCHSFQPEILLQYYQFLIQYL